MYRIIAGPFDGYIAYNDQDELVFVQAPLINCANGCAEADRDVLSFGIDEAANFPPLEFDLADDSEVVSLEPSQIADADGRVGNIAILQDIGPAIDLVICCFHAHAPFAAGRGAT